MTVLLTGASGCLGTYLLRTAPGDMKIVATAFRREVSHECLVHIDLRTPQSVTAAFERVSPDLVIHAAYDKTDLQGGIIQATKHLVDNATRSGAQFIHISSDLVLDGEHAPYDELAPAKPILPYGAAKAEAEDYVRKNLPDAATVRTSLILGEDPVNPSSAWIIDTLSAGQNVTLFGDEYRCPILAEDLAGMIWDIAALKPSQQGGVWNCVGPERLNRLEIGVILAKRFGLNPDLLTRGKLADSNSPRPRDLSMTTARANRWLKTHARPISTLLNNL